MIDGKRKKREERVKKRKRGKDIKKRKRESEKGDKRG